jgi:flagellar motor protein MotB
MPAWQANSPGGLFAGAGQFPASQAAAADSARYDQLSQQVASLNARLGQFDSDNSNLHTQIAALQQRLQNATSYNDQLRQQLAGTVQQLQQAQAQNQQLAASQSPATIPSASGGMNPSPWQNVSTGGATIRANNGLMDRLNTVELPGFRTWMDGDVIRIEGPTDRLFVSGTWQINNNDAMALAGLAGAIRQHFPRQVVGIEAHWDGSPIQPATMSHHQLTATQALAVFDLLVKSGLPNAQVFTMGMGSNRPRYQASATQNGISPNRRIEIVIYPETFQ